MMWEATAPLVMKKAAQQAVQVATSYSQPEEPS
jgi:hypothetical protein